MPAPAIKTGRRNGSDGGNAPLPARTAGSRVELPVNSLKKVFDTKSQTTYTKRVFL